MQRFYYSANRGLEWAWLLTSLAEAYRPEPEITRNNSVAGSRQNTKTINQLGKKQKTKGFRAKTNFYIQLFHA